ncbi:MAG: 3-dehydroquinate synthase family protein, partial [Bryobacteraceae bacterium]
KNLVGAFHQPIAVLIDPDVLATLPEREYRAGLFEILKCALLGSPSLFELLTTRSGDVLARKPEAVERMISECVRIKAEVVSADEKESGLRMILNLGHTVGHALEAETGYTAVLHGEAVGFGLRAATCLARRTGHLPAEDAAIILNAIEMYGPISPSGNVTADALSRRLLMDKKNIRGQVHWVLPKRVGEVEIVTGIRPEDVRAAIQEALS